VKIDASLLQRKTACSNGSIYELPHVLLARDYLEPRGIAVKEFESAGCEVTVNAHAFDPIFPAAPALVFNFFDPFTREKLTYTDAQGGQRPFRRIRPLNVRGAKFLQPRDSGTRVFFAQHRDIGWPTILSDPTYGLVLTEGETRSLAGVTRGLPIISITGVDCGQVGGELHPDLAAVNWRERLVFLCFDSDVSRKDGPRLAIAKLAGLLRARGADVFQTSIPPAADGSKQGVDDLLARHGAPAFTALLQSQESQPAASIEAYEPPVLLRDLMAASYPPTQWVWDQFVLKNEVNLLFGDGGVGKSLLALHLAIAAAAGRPLFGSTALQTPVLALFAEDGPAQVQQRATSILIEFGLDARPDLPFKLWCQPRGETALAQIDDNGTVKELPRLHALRAELAACGVPALVVLDSLADLFALNESLRLPVNAALKQVLGGLCRDFGATVLVLAHPSKASMQDGSHYSGSTAFNNAVRQRLTLEIGEREPGQYTEGPPPRVLKVAKSNYGAAAEKRLWYYGATIVELPRNNGGDEGKAASLRKVCVAAAIEAASKNVPLNRRDAIPFLVFKDAEEALGRRPSTQEVRNALNDAVLKNELRFVSHSRHRASGYFPPEEEVAHDLARAAMRASKRSSRSSADA